MDEPSDVKARLGARFQQAKSLLLRTTDQQCMRVFVFICSVGVFAVLSRDLSVSVSVFHYVGCCSHYPSSLLSLVTHLLDSFFLSFFLSFFCFAAARRSETDSAAEGAISPDMLSDEEEHAQSSTPTKVCACVCVCVCAVSYTHLTLPTNSRV